MFANDVYTRSIAIRLDIYNRNLDYRLGDSYKQYYESCLRKKKAFCSLIEAKKTFFALKVMTYPYSESEFDALMASYSVINDAYSALETSMNLLKITIDAYNELI